MSGLTLSELLDGLAEVPALLADTPVSALTLDSRRVQPGGAFVALAGATTHGLQHADAAITQGASCLLFEPPAPDAVALPSTAVAVPALRKQLGSLADRFYDTPSARLTMIGVTGTNGKTSTVQLLAQALDDSDDGPAGSLGTLGMGFAGSTRAGERTTPDVISVHAALAELSELGARAVAMEVSSHALDQGRVDAVAFDIAVFSNLTRDHLDYHGDMARYGAAKARLFEWPTLRAAVVNIDDPFGRTLYVSLSDELDCWTVSGAGDKAARLRAGAVQLDSGGLSFDLIEGGDVCSVRSRLLGRFNVDNLLAVAGSLRALGWCLADVAARLATLAPVAGRMNRIDAPAGSPLVVVDYAHTPDALAQALDSLRAHASGRIICVFGCGGDRDRGKRPQMAQAVASRAALAILTDDNPRFENGDQIIADTVVGFASSQAVLVERDRERAIARALSEATAADIVLIAGKGHENYQEVGDDKRAFDDTEVARRLLVKRNGVVFGQEAAA